MKKYFNILSAVMLVGMAVVMTATIRTVGGIGNTRSITAAGTYTYSQTDTIKWAREKGVKGLVFAARYSDTVHVTTARVLRVVNGKPIKQGAAQVGDTLPNLTAVIDSTPANATAGIYTNDRIRLEGLAYNATTFSATPIGIVPLADEYWVIVQYDSLLGTSDFAAGAVTYEFIKEY